MLVSICALQRSFFPSSRASAFGRWGQRRVWGGEIKEKHGVVVDSWNVNISAIFEKTPSKWWGGCDRPHQTYPPFSCTNSHPRPIRQCFFAKSSHEVDVFSTRRPLLMFEEFHPSQSCVNKSYLTMTATKYFRKTHFPEAHLKIELPQIFGITLVFVSP